MTPAEKPIRCGCEVGSATGEKVFATHAGLYHRLGCPVRIHYDERRDFDRACRSLMGRTWTSAQAQQLRTLIAIGEKPA